MLSPCRKIDKFRIVAQNSKLDFNVLDGEKIATRSRNPRLESFETCLVYKTFRENDPLEL